MSTTMRRPSGPVRADQPSDPGPYAPFPAAPPPVGAGPVPALGILLAVTVTALGVIALRDGLAGTGAISGQDWLGTRLASVAELSPAAWMLPVGVLAAVVGVALLLIALRPRRAAATGLSAAPGVYLGARDLARIAVTAAEDVDGVISAKAAGTHRSLTVTLRTTGAADAVEQVRTAATGQLSGLDPTPRVRVRASSERGQR